MIIKKLDEKIDLSNQSYQKLLGSDVLTDFKSKHTPHNQMLSALGLNNKQLDAESVYDDSQAQLKGAPTKSDKRSGESSTERVQSSDFLVKHSSTPLQAVENKGDQNTSFQPGDPDDDSSS